MPKSYRRWVRRTPGVMFVVSVSCAALAFLLSSCSADLPVRRDDQQMEKTVTTVSYSIVFVIHGDGDYLYHDTGGREYNADEEALAKAKMVAQRNPHAEVFIFHQKPRRHVLLLFPIHDGEVFYYRGGRLIANELYWRDQSQSHFNPEVELYKRFGMDTLRERVNIFLYCGHEIPEFGGAGYNASFPDRSFTVHDLADEVQGFARDSARFDLMVLSTCYGGTPYTIKTLGSFARYIIASPDNLHLSYFDFHSLDRLDLNLQNGNVAAFAKAFARQAFDRLTSDVQTAVSVVVYDVDRVQQFLHSVDKMYDVAVKTLHEETQASLARIGHCDCADLPMYMLPTMNDGVDVLYRPARFGRSRNKQMHSGWECWSEQSSRTATSQIAEPALK